MRAGIAALRRRATHGGDGDLPGYMSVHARLLLAVLDSREAIKAEAAEHEEAKLAAYAAISELETEVARLHGKEERSSGWLATALGEAERLATERDQAVELADHRRAALEEKAKENVELWQLLAHVGSRAEKTQEENEALRRRAGLLTSQLTDAELRLAHLETAARDTDDLRRRVERLEAAEARANRRRQLRARMKF